MEDPQTIPTGQYLTARGKTVYIYDWGKNMLGEWCYRGTVKGEGFGVWDKNGRSLAGNDCLLLESCNIF